MCLFPNSFESNNCCLSCFDRYYCESMSLGERIQNSLKVLTNLVTTAETLQLALVS